MGLASRRPLEQLKAVVERLPVAPAGRAEEARSQQEDLARLYQDLARYKDVIQLAALSLMTRRNLVGTITRPPLPEEMDVAIGIASRTGETQSGT